jgi:hypothetical protein
MVDPKALTGVLVEPPIFLLGSGGGSQSVFTQKPQPSALVQVLLFGRYTLTSTCVLGDASWREFKKSATLPVFTD